jgi:hypothetical protein
MDIAKVYPYVVPAGYIEVGPSGPDGFILPLGHDIFAMLVHDIDGLCQGVLPDELTAAGMDAPALHRRALHNLESLAEGSDIQKSKHQAPGGMPFILWSSHWLAASCIRLPGLHAFASKLLNTDMVCVSVPSGSPCCCSHSVPGRGGTRCGGLSGRARRTPANRSHGSCSRSRRRRSIRWSSRLSVSESFWPMAGEPDISRR